MAYDQTGTELRVGDRVMIPAIVTGINANGPAYCNLALELEHPIDPSAPPTKLAVNMRQVVGVKQTPTAETGEQPAAESGTATQEQTAPGSEKTGETAKAAETAPSQPATEHIGSPS